MDIRKIIGAVLFMVVIFVLFAAFVSVVYAFNVPCYFLDDACDNLINHTNEQKSDCCSSVPVQDAIVSCCKPSSGAGCCFLARIVLYEDNNNILATTYLSVLYDGSLKPQNVLDSIFKPPKV